MGFFHQLFSCFNRWPYGKDLDLSISTATYTVAQISRDWRSINITGTLTITGSGEIAVIGCRYGCNITGSIVYRNINHSGGTWSATTLNGKSISYTVNQSSGGSGGNGYGVNNAVGPGAGGGGYGGAGTNGYGGGGGGGGGGWGPSAWWGNGGNGGSGNAGGNPGTSPGYGYGHPGGGGSGNGTLSNGSPADPPYSYPTSPYSTLYGGNGGKGGGSGGGGGAADGTTVNRYAAGGGGGGGYKGFHGGGIYIKAASFSGSGTFNVSGSDGYIGGNSTARLPSVNGGGGGGGGGGGAGGSSGAVWLDYIKTYSGYTFNYTVGQGKSGGSGGAGDWGTSPGGGSGANGTYSAVIPGVAGSATITKVN